MGRACRSNRLWTHSSERQIEFFKLNFREKARSRTDHGADIITRPAPQDNYNSPQRDVSSFPQRYPGNTFLSECLALAGCVSSPSAPSLVIIQEGATMAL